MMIERVSYNRILESYHEDLDAMDADYIQIAMEADDIGNPENNTAIPSKLLERLKTFINKIVSLIDRGLTRLKNVIRKLGVGTNQFKLQMRRRETEIKPLKKVTVTGYDYNTNALSDAYSKAFVESINVINRLSMITGGVNIDEEYGSKSERDLLNIIFKASIGKECNDVEEFLQEMKSRYRGQKKEFTFYDTQARVICSKAEGNSQFKADTVLTRDINKLKATINNMKSATRLIQNSHEPDEKKRKYVQAVSKASKIYSFANTLCSYAHELLIEQTMYWRIIAKKFYQF